MNEYIVLKGVRYYNLIQGNDHQGRVMPNNIIMHAIPEEVKKFLATVPPSVLPCRSSSLAQLPAVILDPMFSPLNPDISPLTSPPLPPSHVQPDTSLFLVTFLLSSYLFSVVGSLLSLLDLCNTLKIKNYDICGQA
jgi:hypothetical protein